MDRFVDKNGNRFDVGSWVLAPDQEGADVVTGVDFQGEEPLVFVGGIHDGCWIRPSECVVWHDEFDESETVPWALGPDLYYADSVGDKE
jgi:hypothetical protein